MADLPVEIDAGGAATGDAAGNAGGDFLRGYATLPIVRQLGLMLALAATVAVGVSVVLWMREPDYKPLTGIGSARQANAAAEALQAANIPYRRTDHGYCLSIYVQSPDNLRVEFTVDCENADEIAETRRKDAHSELRRWLSGDHRINNNIRYHTR